MLQFEKNPFPGMNPWLESHWSDVHTSMTTYARDAIQLQLPADLHARVEEYLSVDEQNGAPNERHRRIALDIHIAQRSGLTSFASSSQSTSVGWVDDQTEPIRTRRRHEAEVLRYIEILDLKANRRVVTAIEFLSQSAS